jgi:hypothetical protein
VSDPEATRDALARATAGELLGPADLAAIFGLKHSQFGKLLKEGAFDAFKVRPAIGRRCFSGRLVAKYLEGEPIAGPVFGRPRKRA